MLDTKSELAVLLTRWALSKGSGVRVRLAHQPTHPFSLHCDDLQAAELCSLRLRREPVSVLFFLHPVHACLTCRVLELTCSAPTPGRPLSVTTEVGAGLGVGVDSGSDLGRSRPFNDVLPRTALRQQRSTARLRREWTGHGLGDSPQISWDRHPL